MCAIRERNSDQTDRVGAVGLSEGELFARAADTTADFTVRPECEGPE